MSEGITREEAKKCVGEGWSKLLDNIYDNLRPETYVMQVKEKFGGLRFYVGSATTEEFDIIDKAEEDSYTICETCGKEGKLREDLGWILTLCDEHYQLTKEAQENRMKRIKKSDDLTDMNNPNSPYRQSMEEYNKDILGN